MSAHSICAGLARAGVFLPAFVIAGAGHAQSFDCAKARPPIETAICAAPDLRTLDNALAGAYARAQFALKDEPAALDALKQAQRAFNAERGRACAAPQDLVACLARLYRGRLDALAAYRAPATPQQTAARTTSAQPAAALQAPAPQPPAQQAPVAPVLVEVAPPVVPANAASGALIRIPAPGRYAIRAESATGVALQLVDMIAGPGDVAGAAGQRNGRLDQLLDAGTYKLRAFGAKGATGEARIVAQAYSELSRAPLPVAPVQGELRDLQQISFWVDVGDDGRIAVEAVGRALSDLRLWRDGEALEELVPEIGAVEAQKARLVTRARLSGVVAPGRYLVTAYGGPLQIWTEGGEAAPFMIRRIDPVSLAAGLYDGALGPFGAAHFEAAAEVDYVRLELPQPAPVRLILRRKGQPPLETALAANSRDPFIVAIPRGAGGPVEIEVAGLEGQLFRLRALHRAAQAKLSGEGPSLVFVDVAGEGGDEIPAAAVLARIDRGKASVLAADAPKIAPGGAWRRRFNLRGPSTIIFEATGAGPLAIALKGRVARASIEPAFGGTPLAARAEMKTTYDLAPGYYTLRLAPPDNGAGVIDLTLGSPGLAPELAPAPAARTAIDLGRVTMEKGVSYEARVNEAPNLAAGVRAVALPADLAKGPVAFWQSPRAAPQPAPQQQGAVEPQAPIKTAAPGAKPEFKAKSTLKSKPKSKSESKPAALAQSAKPQTPPASSAGAQSGPAQSGAAQSASAPSADTTLRVRAPRGGRILARDHRGADIAFDMLDERVETDHRAFLLRLPATSAPRAVAILWRADPKPARAATTQAALPVVAPDAPAFFDLARDQKREFRIEAKEGGLYRIETLGRLATGLTVGTNFLPRLARAQDNGRGRNALAQTYLRAGAYRVGVSALERSSGRVGLALAPAELATTGLLTDGASVRARLSDGRGARVPIEIAKAGVYALDLYALERDLFVRLEDEQGWPLNAPGRLKRIEMQLEPGKYRLVVAPEDTDARMVARLTAKPVAILREGHGPHALPFGAEQKHQWREPVASGAPRAPDIWTFALAGDADVELSLSDGMIGRILRGDNESVGQFVAGRPFKGKLAAGAYRVETRALARDDRLDYTLALDAAQMQPGAPHMVDLPASVAFTLAEAQIVNLTSFGRKDLTGVLKDAQGRLVERLAGRADDWNIALARALPAGAYKLDLYETSDSAPLDAASEPEAQEGEGEGEDEGATDDATPADGVEVNLTLPTTSAPQMLGPSGAARFADARAHRFTLPPAPGGALALVAAQSSAEVALSVEWREADGLWREVGRARGRAPVVAWPAAPGEGRAVVWSLDGANETIAVAARAIEAAPKTGAEIALDSFPLPELGLTLNIARLATPGANALDLALGAHEILAGASAGRALQPTRAGLLAPQGETVWIVARDLQKLGLAPAQAADGPMAFVLQPGESMRLPAARAPQDRLRIWRAHAGAGQPALDAGHGGAIAEGAAAALAGAAPLRLWNAGADDALRVDIDKSDLAQAPEIKVDSGFAGVLAPHSAQPLILPAGEKRIALDLARGAAAFSGLSDKARLAVMAETRALSRALVSEAQTLVLANLSDQPAPVRLSFAPAKGETLAPGRISKRFHGAAGGFALQVNAQPGDILRVEGGAATFVSAQGAVRRGGEIKLDGPGEIVVDHGPGLVALWLERGGESPWPKTPAQPTALPANVLLQGAAQAFALDVKSPGLLDLSTSAPAIVVLEQNGRRETALYAAGADFHRFVAAGPAVVTLYPPHEGALSGAASLSLSAPIAAREGVGEPVALAAGASALFAFDVAKESDIGLGLRTEPDRASGRLLDAQGKSLAEGVSLMRKLAPGRYWFEARAPADSALVARLSLIGVAPPPAQPPREEIEALLEKAGLKAPK